VRLTNSLNGRVRLLSNSLKCGSRALLPPQWNALR
jgi:hypothetical protein